MMIAVSIVVCMIAHPNVCEGVPLQMSVGSMEACMAAGEEYAATTLDEEWRLERVRCSPGFVDENHG